jgi:hypothetical protein
MLHVVKKKEPGEKRFEAFMVVKIEAKVFWVVIPCSVVVGYQQFRELCYLCLQGEVMMREQGFQNVGTLLQH